MHPFVIERVLVHSTVQSEDVVLHTSLCCLDRRIASFLRPDHNFFFFFFFFPCLPSCPPADAMRRRSPPDTGNSCKHVGYDEFEPESWPSDCAPNKSDWIELDRKICGEDQDTYPEEFWGCADISIT